MLNRLLVLLLVYSSLHGVPDSDLERFRARADDLSRQMSLKMERHEEEVAGYARRTTNYILTSKSRVLTVNVVGEVATTQTRGSLFEAHGKASFLSAHFKTLFGPYILAESLQQEATKESSDRLVQLVKDSEALQQLPSTPERVQQIARLNRERAALVHLNQDTRTLAGGVIDFRARDWATPQEPMRWLTINGVRLEGQHPRSNAGLSFAMGVAASRKVDGRRGGNSIADLKEAGLVDDSTLLVVRSSYAGLPMDYWTPIGASSLEHASPLEPGITIPGIDGPKSSVVIGQHPFVTDFVPSNAKVIDKDFPAETFLVPRSDQRKINPFVDYERPASSNWVNTYYSDQNTFPAAGLQDDDRVFVAYWVALSGHQGILAVVQYEAENEPRVAIFDPSGIIIRLSKGEANFGCLAATPKDIGAISWHPTSLTRGKAPTGLHLREITRISLPSNPSGSPIPPLDASKAKTRSVELVIPRSLW